MNRAVSRSFGDVHLNSHDASGRGLLQAHK